MEFIVQCLRVLFFTLDTIVFGLIDDVYALLMQISRTTIFDQDALHNFSQRVYVMLGLFMLLKVMISIINYILNPDDLVDKEKGFANIIKRMILSLVMIVLVPYVFREAYELQAIILNENTIMTIVFGSPGESYRTQSGKTSSNSSFYDTAGQKIQFTVMYAFAQPNYEEFSGTDYDLTDCRDTYAKKDGNYVFRDKYIYGKKSSGKSKYIYELNESCFGVYDSDNDVYKEDGDKGQLIRLFKKINDTDKDSNAESIVQNYIQGVAQQSFSIFFKKNAILAKTETGKYAIDYKWGVSTAIGVAVVYLLLIFCIDIAGRSIKLGFLQLISPIPILSYCDPKSSKDGMFKKWYTMCFKAYAELFIKLFALYFGIYIISLVGTFKDVLTNTAVDNNFVSVFMVIGVLMFIKKLPEIIKDALGVDLGGKLELNPIKKLENEVAGFKGAKKLAGGVVAGTAAGAAAFGTNMIARKGNVFSALAGAASASSKGLVGGLKGEKFGKNFSNSYGAAMKNRQSRQDRHDDEVGWSEMMGARMRQKMGMHSKADIVKSANDHLSKIQAANKNIQSQMSAMDTNNFKISDLAGHSGTTGNAAIDKFRTMNFNGVKDLSKYKDEVSKTTIDRGNYKNASGGIDENAYQEAVKQQQDLINEIQSAIDHRTQNIIDRTGRNSDGSVSSTGDTGTDSIIRDAYRTMIDEATAFNAAVGSIDNSIEKINVGDDPSNPTSAKIINGQSIGRGAAVASSSAAQHIDKVQQYGAKSDQK